MGEVTGREGEAGRGSVSGKPGEAGEAGAEAGDRRGSGEGRRTEHRKRTWK